ncbi:unnamed protein product [Amoebophrya sp. A25]|nr:unnamed protein product [Amoebophrya sp. A25]|eukprot:GSA25T00012380001.1
MNIIPDCILTNACEWREVRRAKLGVRFDEDVDKRIRVRVLDDEARIWETYLDRLGGGQTGGSSSSSSSAPSDESIVASAPAGVPSITKTTVDEEQQEDEGKAALSGVISTEGTTAPAPAVNDREVKPVSAGAEQYYSSTATNINRDVIKPEVSADAGYHHTQICAAILGKSVDARAIWRFPRSNFEMKPSRGPNKDQQEKQEVVAGVRVLLHGKTWITSEPCLILNPVPDPVSVPIEVTGEAQKTDEDVAPSSSAIKAPTSVNKKHVALLAFLCEVEKTTAAKRRRLEEAKVKLESATSREADEKEREAQIGQAFLQEKEKMITRAIALINEEKAKNRNLR